MGIEGASRGEAGRSGGGEGGRAVRGVRGSEIGQAKEGRGAMAVELHVAGRGGGKGDCRCFTTDSLPRGFPRQYVRASAYAELDGERKRQTTYPGSGPRLLIE